MAQDTSQDRVTIQEAARRLGIKEDAVRKRIQRGTLRHDKTSDRVYVYVDTTQDATQDEYQDNSQAAARASSENQEELVEALRDQVEYLRQQLDIRTEELRRKDHIIAALTDRIPELEAPHGYTEASQSAEESSEEDRPGESRERAQTGSHGPQQPSGEESQRRSWWRRLVGRP